ncbi:unnamed protein product, partial [Allacma fusca]
TNLEQDIFLANLKHNLKIRRYAPLSVCLRFLISNS